MKYENVALNMTSFTISKKITIKKTKTKQKQKQKTKQTNKQNLVLVTLFGNEYLLIYLITLKEGYLLHVGCLTTDTVYTITKSNTCIQEGVLSTKKTLRGYGTNG